MAENIFSQILKKQLAKGQPIAAPQVRSVGIVPDVRSPLAGIKGGSGRYIVRSQGGPYLSGFNAKMMAGDTPYIRGAKNIGPMPTTPDPRLPMRPLGSVTTTAPRSGVGAMGALGLVELGLTGIDQIGRAFNPDFARKRNIADEYAAKFGADYSLTPEEMAKRLGKDDTTTYSSQPGFVGPVPQPEALGGKAGPPLTLPGNQRGAWTIKGWDPNASRTTPGAMTAAPGIDVAPPAPQLPPSAFPGASPQERAYQQEIARTQQMAAANPYFQQMDLYAQGQRAMQTQEDMNKVRDLGLAINAAKFGTPEQRMQQTVGQVNPLMTGLTPPGPAQPVIAMDEEGRIGQLDTAAAGVQDFMRKYAEGMKKRKGEE